MSNQGMSEEKKIQLYGPVVGIYESSKKNGKYYNVRRKDANSYSCQCLGWIHNRRCKHCDAARSGDYGMMERGKSAPKSAPAKISKTDKKGSGSFDLGKLLDEL